MSEAEKFKLFESKGYVKRMLKGKINSSIFSGGTLIKAQKIRLIRIPIP